MGLTPSSLATAYLALGSNLDNPIFQLERTLKTLMDSSLLKVDRFSSIYQSPPYDASKQPDYCNLVTQIKTKLKPIELLNYLKEIEKQQGRKQAEKWSARIIDIDILLYDDSIHESKELTIPHPGLKLRNFFLKPLIEIINEQEGANKIHEFQGVGALKPHLDLIESPIHLVKPVKQIEQSIFQNRALCE